MRNFLLFVLALVFCGAMISTHAPQGLTTPSDMEIKRVAKLKSVAASDSSTIAVANIPMKISVPYFVLPIPDKKLNESYPLSLSVSISNDTPNIIQAGDENLTPEVVAPDGQILQLQKATSQNLDAETFCKLVEPGTGKSFSSAAIAWKNNKLQLYGQAGLGYLWYFDDLQPGTYQLSFSYYSAGGDITCFDISKEKFRQVKGLGMGKGTTTKIPIRIVQPQTIDSNTVEIDGVRFEIVMPQRVLPIPANKPNATTSIKIALRITNKTTTPLRFQGSNKTLQMREQNGKNIRGKGRDGGGDYRTKYNCPLVRPGESVTFNLDTKLAWEDNLLQLIVADRGGGFRNFKLSESGKYQIGIGYYPSTSGGLCNLVQTSNLEENKWRGVGATPDVELRLFQP